MALRRRRSRRQTRGTFRLHKPHWIDPYPSIPGTEPEKRVFASLMLQHVYFIFQGQIPEFEKGGRFYFLAPPSYKPDFVLPEHKVIIDPFSPFHHSLPEAAERDANKVAAYNVMGYAYYHPWAIAPGVWEWSQGVQTVYTSPTNFHKHRKTKPVRGRMDTMQMLASIPELVRGPRFKLTDPRDVAAKRSPGYRLGPYLGAGASSVGAANRSRRRPPKLGLRVGR